MKTPHLTAWLAAVACLALFALAGCTPDDPTGAQRLDDLEARIELLRQETTRRDAAVKAELAQIRKNLEGIRALIELDKQRQGLQAPAEEPRSEDDRLAEDLDRKAKDFVSENLDRLLDLTKKLLDRMEQELDEHMKQAPPAPQGDEL